MSETAWIRLEKVGENTFDVKRCPRCEGEHGSMLFLPFKRPVQEILPRDEDDPVIFHLWAACPATGEPILVTDPKQLMWVVRFPACREKVAAVAEALWELEGKPDGRAELHWFLAEWLVSQPPAFKMAAVATLKMEAMTVLDLHVRHHVYDLLSNRMTLDVIKEEDGRLLREAEGAAY